MNNYIYVKNILFTKLRDVRTPERGTPESAGIDFFMPNIDEDFAKAFLAKNQDSNAVLYRDGFTIPAGERVLIPSGIKVWIENKETMLMAANKSGVATKLGLIFTAEIVDSDYTGEVHLGVYNISHNPVTLYPGDKVMQFIHVPVYLSRMVEVNGETYETIKEFYGTTRGEGGFGSTDYKDPKLFDENGNPNPELIEKGSPDPENVNGR